MLRTKLSQCILSELTITVRVRFPVPQFDHRQQLNFNLGANAMPIKSERFSEPS